ncbi:MAG: CYTH domain-containing protein [Gammaproteobacteria bacterium]|nr:CYTH domain-containing protein [Gammaproteobacteria bacterium]
MKEIELKLSLLEDDPKALFDHPLINHYAKDPSITFDLKTTYYDTDDFALLKAGIALRIREDENGDYIQTVKTKGTQVQGLHQRDEYDNTLHTNALDLQTIDMPDLRQQLLEIAKTQTIKALFHTQFSRTKWLLELPKQCLVELVLDLGEVVAGKSSIPLQEIELELVQGKAMDCLFELAASIAGSMPIAIEDRSKAWKGYQLYQAIAASKAYHDPRLQERQLPDFFLEQAALLRAGAIH